MARGRERRKETYLAQRVDVQRLEIVTIWFGRTVSRLSESAGNTGFMGGQFGAGCWIGPVVDLAGCFCFVDFDLGAMTRLGGAFHGFFVLQTVRKISNLRCFVDCSVVLWQMMIPFYVTDM